MLNFIFGANSSDRKLVKFKLISSTTEIISLEVGEKSLSISVLSSLIQVEKSLF